MTRAPARAWLLFGLAVAACSSSQPPKTATPAAARSTMTVQQYTANCVESPYTDEIPARAAVCECMGRRLFGADDSDRIRALVMAETIDRTADKPGSTTGMMLSACLKETAR